MIFFAPEHTSEIRALLAWVRSLAIPMLSCSAIIALLLLMSVRPDSYAHSLAMKEDLLRETPGARLIIVGGSGSSSSIDAGRIAERYGLSPISMGVYAGLGMRYVVNQVIDDIHEGDIVLVAPEYEMLQQRATGDGFLLLEMLHANPGELFEIVTPRGLMVMTRAFPGWLVVQVERIGDRFLERIDMREPTDTERLYVLEHVLPHGELDIASAPDTMHLSDDIVAPQGDGFILPSMNPRVKPYLTELAFVAHERGARMYVVMPVMPEAIQGANEANASAQHDELVGLIGPERVLGSADTFVYPSVWFLDSLGHLTERGKEARTDGIISLLDEALGAGYHTGTPSGN